MSVLNSINKASIDNFVFLVNNDETRGGRRQREYEYISTNRRQVQDLGLYLRKFKISGTIAYDISIDGDYLAQRDKLISILESNKTHVLIHPFYGTVNVATGIYSLRQSFDKLGYADFSFEATEVSNSINNSLPISGGDITQNTINNNSSDASSNAINDNSDDFNITKKFKDSYQSAKDIAINTLRSIQDVISPIAEDIDDLANFIKNIENDIENINSLLNNTTSLFTVIFDSITGIDGFTSDIIAAITGLKRLNEFGSSINNFTSQTTDTDKKLFSIDALSPNIKVNPIPITTQDIEIKNNADIIINSVKQASLITQYRLSTQIDYDTTNDIKQAADDLEKQYINIQNSFSDNLIENMSQLRSSNSKVLDNKRLNTSNETDLELFSYTPLSVISYNLYDDSSESDIIKKLNNINDIIAVDGSIKVLSNARITN